jgi:hypothetical protein
MVFVWILNIDVEDDDIDVAGENFYVLPIFQLSNLPKIINDRTMNNVILRALED